MQLSAYYKDVEREVGSDCEERLAKYNMVTPASLVKEITQNPLAAITRGVNIPKRKKKSADDDDDDEEEEVEKWTKKTDVLYYEEDNYYGLD